MRMLVVGGGGREHALVWKLSQSPLVKEILCAPGNAGIAEVARCAPVAAEDIGGLLSLARREAVDLTVVGPELPLVGGITEAFAAAGLEVFGPDSRAAEIEGSKAFAKALMERWGIPTARHATFAEPGPALEYVRRFHGPVVVKADGLAAGKGVTVAAGPEEATQAVVRLMRDRVFGEAGARVVIEEKLEGEEVSVMVFCDGESVAPMVAAQDYKRVFDGDAGPNTGGMGAYSSPPVYTEKVAAVVMDTIVEPAVRALREEGRPFRGVLYAGLMITADGPRVLEFNARFGDPETQVVLPRLRTDLAEVMLAVSRRELRGMKLEWSDQAAVCVVVASGGYPGEYRQGFPVSGLEEARRLPGVTVFHAGTRREGNVLVTAGGRVLGVTAVADSMPLAVERAYAAVSRLHFAGMHYRRDIARWAGGKRVSRR